MSAAESGLFKSKIKKKKRPMHNSQLSKSQVSFVAYGGVALLGE